MRVQHSSAQHQTPLPPSLRHSRSSREASERPTELTSLQCHHDPKPVWILKSSVEMFPVAALLLVVLFLGFHGSCAVHWWLTLLECVFKGAMCSVHSWMLYFYVKIPTGTRIARVSDLRPSTGFVAGLEGERKKSCCGLKRKASVWLWWKSEPHTHVAHIWSEVGYMYTGSSTHNTFNITDLWGFSFSGVLNSSVF